MKRQLPGTTRLSGADWIILLSSAHHSTALILDVIWACIAYSQP
jgi:hypothetical protein